MIVLEINNFGRHELADLLRQLDFKAGVEVGVANGVYSRVLCQANPQMKLYGVDPFVPYKGYTDYKLKQTFAGMRQRARDTLTPFPNYEFIEEFSAEAAKRFSDGSLDFVYVDANHTDPYVSEDINIWYKKLRPGGILAGHDYQRTRDQRNDTIQATKKFAQENNKILFVLGTDRVIPGDVRDRPRSWMLQK